MLLKLKLNLIYEDIVQRFSISVNTAWRIFDKWIDMMYYRLKFLIKWPSRDVANYITYPELSKKRYILNVSAS